MNRIVLAAVVAALGAAALGSGQTHTVMVTGDAAPGTPAGVNFFALRFPVLNDAGQVAFEASLTGSGVDSTNSLGIWWGGPGSLTLVARSGSPAPGTPAGVNFSSYFLGPVLNDVGEVAFLASLTGSGVDWTNNRGIWRGAPGNLSLVVRTGNPAPDTESGVNFASFFDAPMLNDGGQVAFQASLAGSGVDSSNNAGIWRGGPGSLSLVARTGRPAPGTESGVNFLGMTTPVLNDAGQVAFFASLTGSGVDSSNDRGIWQGAPGSLSLVARRGSSALGTAPGVDFSSFFSPVLNDAGQVAFKALLTGSGVDSSNSQGIWRGAAGSLSLVARTGSPAPGTESGVDFTFLSSFPVLNNAGQMAFGGSLTGSGVDSTNNLGIWWDGSGSLSLVARKGSQAPGTASGANFSSFDAPMLNDAGQVAFWARLTGSGVDSSNDQGIWMSDGSESLLVARSGDLLAGRTIYSVWLLRSLQALNDYAQVTYRAVFTDGSAGVFLFTPDVHWRGTFSSGWDFASNWTLSIPPGPVHDVSISPDASIVITGPSSVATVKSLAIGGGEGLTELALQADSPFMVLEDLTIAGNGVITSPGSLDVGRISIESGGKLDLAAGKLIVQDQPLEEVAALIAWGYAAGDWGGDGITSSIAATQSGRAVGMAPHEEDVLVMFTFAGDANLDGMVNVSDLSILAANWQGTGRMWFQGDFNFDGVVNVSDLSILAANWQKGVGGADGGAVGFEEAMGMFDVFGGVTVPEPGVVGLVGLGVLGMRRRPRRGRSGLRGDRMDEGVKGCGGVGVRDYGVGLIRMVNSASSWAVASNSRESLMMIR